MVNQTVQLTFFPARWKCTLEKCFLLQKGICAISSKKPIPTSLDVFRAELIDHLFKQAPSAGYSEDELLQALEKTDDR
jgi:hypothetical protein